MLSHNPVIHSKTKHMELDLLFAREKVVNKRLFITSIPAEDQTADDLTKVWPNLSFCKLRDKLRVLDLYAQH